MENVANAMHSNLKPPDVAPSLLRFNYGAHKQKETTDFYA